MYTWFSQGFAILARTGGQVKTAHCLGAGENESAAQYARGALQLGILFAVLYGLVSIFGASRLIGFFKLNSPEVIAQAEWYVRIACGLVIFSYLNAILTGLLTAAGNSRTPFIVNVAGLVFNVVLDPVLIFGIGPFPELGVSGAAAATVTAQALVSLLFFKAVLREKVLFPHLRLWVLVPVKVWREIVRIGVPSAVQNLIYAGISMILTRLITGWGDLAVAAQRVGSQIESVSWMVGDGFSAAVNAFLGQNYGAKRYDRVRRGYFCAIAMTAAWGLCTTFLLIGMARPLFSIFLQEEEVMAIGVNYLRIVGLSQMFMMVEQTSIGAFSGLGRTLYPSIISVTFTSARIPVAVLLSSVMGLSGIWWALSISSMVKGCILFVSFVVFLYVFLERKKDEKTV
ncbi:MATE family efflux transporter [Clostridium sp. CAG:43]|nr:MATE family efflux transporter [Clostridium sp. CAG:43]CDD55985.1 putative uncharacterized protein [Clostridium sp. CAG:43]